MSHGPFAGITDYSNQSLDSIGIDITELQNKAEQLYKNKNVILSRVEEINKAPKYADSEYYNLYNFMGNLTQFFKFVEEILLKDNLEVIDAILAHRITEQIIKKMEIIDDRGWKFNGKFSKSFPGDFFTFQDEEEVELHQIYRSIEDLITSLMDYANMASRLKEFIVESNNFVSLKSVIYKACCNFLDTKRILTSETENDINTFIRTFLSSNDLLKVSDQTLRGESAQGKTLGEVDIRVECNDKISIIEALKIDSLNKSYIIEHINRLKKYDQLGNNENFILVYFKGDNFSKFVIKYQELILKSLSDDYNKLRVVEDRTLSVRNIKVFDMTYFLNSDYSKITHIILNI